MIISSDGAARSITFAVLGNPPAQNGWALRYHGIHHPYLYDPLRRDKNKLHNNLMKEMSQLGESAPFFTRTHVRVTIRYHFHGPTRKDLDNMTKFFLDAMEGALYDNDKWIFSLVTEKEEAIEGLTTVSISHNI